MPFKPIISGKTTLKQIENCRKSELYFTSIEYDEFVYSEKENEQ
jgi:hypothetical protein